MRAMQADMNVQCYIATSSKQGAALERQVIASLTCATISRIKVHYGFQSRRLSLKFSARQTLCSESKTRRIQGKRMGYLQRMALI